MKLLRRTSKIMAVILSIALMAPANVLIAADESVTTKIKHKPEGSYYPGFRIRITGEIKDEAGIEMARCYFKVRDETEYLFVDMLPVKGAAYEGVMPAPWLGSKAVNYFLLVLNKEKKVVKTQIYEITEDHTDEVKKWEEAKNTAKSKDELEDIKKELRKRLREANKDQVEDFQKFDDERHMAVSTEAVIAPAEAAGFHDKLIITAAEKGKRYALLPSTKVAAATGGISNTALLGGLAVAAAGGGIAAAAGSSGGSSGGGDTGSDLPGGTGEVKVTLQWSSCSDLDLSVTDPCGTRIYYATRSSVCDSKTGTLDVDANRTCSITSCTVPAENIFWTTAPAGNYTVEVDYFMDCGDGDTPYTVTRIVDGQRQTFSGMISDGQTKMITTFTK